MKRFTETLKWDDAWFRKLSPNAKLFWFWLVDKCDQAGVVEPDYEAASFQIGAKISESILDEYGDRIRRLNCVKLWLLKFVSFQYGELSDSCPAHKPVFRRIKEHEKIGYQYPIDTLQEKKRNIIGKELVSESVGVSQCYAAGVPEDFAKYVYADWFSRDGKDASSVEVQFVRFAKKRWDRERAEWMAGTHKGKPKKQTVAQADNQPQANLSKLSADEVAQCREYFATKRNGIWKRFEDVPNGEIGNWISIYRHE